MPVHEHKTAKLYLGKIVFRSYLQNCIERYIRNIRLDILLRTQSKSPHTLLQFDGQPFLKLSQAIVALQQKLGIKKPLTISDARRSVETYAKQFGHQHSKDNCNLSMSLGHQVQSIQTY